MKYAGLALLALLSAGCGNSDPWNSPSKERPDSTFAQAYSKFENVKVAEKTEHLALAKLISVTPHSINIHLRETSSDFSDPYFVMTFQVNEKYVTLYSREAMDYIKGMNYDVEYWKLVDKRQYTDAEVFNAFVQGSENYKTRLPKKVDPNLDGVISKISRIDKE